MPRPRDERGYVKKVGKARKMWEGRFHIYVTLPDGTENRRKKTRIIGTCEQLTKREAEDRLREIILRERREAQGLVPSTQSVALPPNATFAEVWLRYRSLKESAWASATRRAVVSVFETAPPNDERKQRPRRPSVLDMMGSRCVAELTRDPLQQLLNNMAAADYSYSAVKKARVYISAALDYAVDEHLISINPAAKLELPGAKLRRPSKREYSLDEMRRLFSAAAAVSVREHLIVRIFYVCGLRPGELFALRLDDLEPDLLRIDEALKDTEKGSKRIGETKTAASNGYVSISSELYQEIETWLQVRNLADPYHRNHKPVSNDLLFPNEAGRTFRIGNYLKRILKPIAAAAGIRDMTYRSLRRTFAHNFQRHGSPKDAQTQLRHSRLEMTGWYMREIPESVRSAVANMDAEIMAKTSGEAKPDGEKIQ